MKSPKCPICTSETSCCYSLYDDRHGCPGLFDLYRCDICGHYHLQGEFTHEQLTSLYNTYYPRVAFDAESILPYKEKKEFPAWFDGENSFAYRWVPRNVRILDIGCGFGETLGYHKQRGCDVFGVETDDNVRLVADKFGCVFHSGLFDEKNYEPGYFDYVTLDQVVEHFAQPKESMTAVAHVLKKNGLAVVCTPNPDGWGKRLFGNKWINWHAPYHLQLFSAESMKRLATISGFRFERCATITSSNWLYYQIAHLLVYPLPGKPNPLWTSGCTLGVGEKILLKSAQLLHAMKISHPITRFFDSLQVGDNHVFFLRKE